jgi:hypothetical protein
MRGSKEELVLFVVVLLQSQLAFGQRGWNTCRHMPTTTSPYILSCPYFALEVTLVAVCPLWSALCMCSTPGLQANLSALSSALASVPASEADMYADEASAAAQLAQLLAPDTPPASVPATPQAGKGQGDHVSVAADAAAKGSEPVTMAIREPPNSSSAAGEPAGSGSGAMPLGLPAP